MNRHRRILSAAAFAGALAVCVSVLLAKPGIVKTRDGRTLEGDVTEKADTVVVAVRGIETSISRDNVDSIQYTGNIEQQYKDKLAKLPKNPSAADHLALARWLFDNHAYALARKETDAALGVDPNNAEATTLWQTISSQEKLEQMRLNTPKTNTGATPPPRTASTTPPPGPASGEGHTASLRKYLGPDEINMIKEAEWTPDDKTVKVTFSNDVKRRYVASASEKASDFNALGPAEQARRILDNGSPDMRKDVKIINDPATLAEFKRSIQPAILTGCATAACHGGPNGGRFFLYSAPENDAASYTNFYLLTQASATVGGAKNMMIDRVYPDASLLAEWGLPVEISKTAHPEIKGVAWRTMYRGKADPGYQNLMKWIGKLNTPEPRYGFTFSLDGGKDSKGATSAPSGDAQGPANAGVGAGGGGPTTNNPQPKPTTGPAIVPKVPPTNTGVPRGPSKQ